MSWIKMKNDGTAEANTNCVVIPIRLLYSPTASKPAVGRVYIVSCTVGDAEYWKIGWTSCCLKKRIWQLQTGSPFELKLVLSIEVNTRYVERVLHSAFEHWHVRNEWFSVSDYMRACAMALLDGRAAA